MSSTMARILIWRLLAHRYIRATECLRHANKHPTFTIVRSSILVRAPWLVDDSGGRPRRRASRGLQPTARKLGCSARVEGSRASGLPQIPDVTQARRPTVASNL